MACLEVVPSPQVDDEIHFAPPENHGKPLSALVASHWFFATDGFLWLILNRGAV